MISNVYIKKAFMKYFIYFRQECQNKGIKIHAKEEGTSERVVDKKYGGKRDLGKITTLLRRTTRGEIRKDGIMREKEKEKEKSEKMQVCKKCKYVKNVSM